MGATGLLGNRLVPHLIGSGHRVKTLSRTGRSSFSVDASQKSELFEVLSGEKFDSIINLIALTDVDMCERNPELANMVNVKTVENVSLWIRDFCPEAHLLQISSDQVYDGQGPHDERNVSMVNHYARTKYAGELAAQLVSSTVIRTNFVGRSFGHGVSGFSDWIFSSLAMHKEIQVLNDVTFSPVAIETLCQVLTELVTRRLNGVFNLGSNLGMSKADFSFEFAKQLGLQTKSMSRINLEDAKFFDVNRPKDMRMISSKLELELGIRLPMLVDEIRKVAKEYE
jgi:dTDP-4-dehydrorhamnose reductase